MFDTLAFLGYMCGNEILDEKTNEVRATVTHRDEYTGGTDGRDYKGRVPGGTLCYLYFVDGEGDWHDQRGRLDARNTEPLDRDNVPF